MESFSYIPFYYFCITSHYNLHFMIKDNSSRYFWKKNVSLFLSAQAISLFGSALVDFAIIWHITLDTKSGLMMTIATACTFVPRLLISLFAGVWADRYNRKRLIMLADSGIALVTLLLAITFLAGYEEVWVLFLVLGLRSIGTGIQTPAVGAILPQIVPDSYLMKVNGINGSLQSVIMLMAPAASGALLATAPLSYIFFIDVITAIIGVAIVGFIPIRSHIQDTSKEPTGYMDELKEGIRYTKKNVFVREMLIMYAFYFFFISPPAFLSPLYIVRAFGEEVWRLTANEIAFSIGMMLGGGIIAWWGGFRNGINTIALSCIVIGITSALLGYPNFVVYLSLLFIMGIFISFFSSTEMSLFQQYVEPGMQGRVFSLVQIVSTAVMPIGMFIFGPLGDVMPIEIQFLICGILITILGIFLFFNKRLKQSVERPPKGTE